MSSTLLLPPRAQLCNRSCSNKTHTLCNRYCCNKHTHFVIGTAVINTHPLRFKRAEFYMGLKSKVGLVAAKASALRINLNIYGTYLPQGIYGARLLFLVSARTNKRHHHHLLRDTMPCVGVIWSVSVDRPDVEFLTTCNHQLKTASVCTKWCGAV